MYHFYWNQAAAAYSSLYFFTFLSLQFSTLKFFVTLFLGTVGPRRLKLGTHVDSGQMYHVYRNQAAAAYSSLYFFIFLSLQFSTLKFFITFFSGTVRPRRLKIVTHVDSGQMYHIYQNQAAAAYSSLYFSIFLSLQFSTLKFFITLFSGTVRPRRLKIGTHLDSGQMYHVYQNQAAAAYSSLYFFIFLSLQFSTLKFFITLFSRTVRPRRLKLGTHIDIGQMYRVYRNQTAASYSSLYFFIFFLSNFQTLKFFVTLLSGTLRPRRLKLGTHVDSGLMYGYTRIRLLLLIPLFIFYFSNIQILKFSSHFSQELWGLEGWNLVHKWTMGGCIVYTRIRRLLHICPFISSFFFLQFLNIKMFLSHLSQELWGLEGWNIIPTWSMGGWIVYTKSFHNIFLQNCEG